MIVEPFTNEKIEDNFNLLGRLFYAALLMAWVPGPMACNGPALGAQAGEAKICEVVMAGGHTNTIQHCIRRNDIVFHMLYRQFWIYLLEMIKVMVMEKHNEQTNMVIIKLPTL